MEGGRTTEGCVFLGHKRRMDRAKGRNGVKDHRRNGQGKSFRHRLFFVARQRRSPFCDLLFVGCTKKSLV